MTTQVKIKHPDINGNNWVTVVCNSVGIAGKKNLITDPNVNADNQVIVQTQSYENLIFNINGVHIVNTSLTAITSDTLTYGQLLALYRSKYNGANPILLNISTTASLVGVDGTTTDIKTVLKDFSFPISTTDSRNAYMPVFSFSLVETR